MKDYRKTAWMLQVTLLVFLLCAACSHVPPAATVDGSLSLTPSAEHPGYLLISKEDLDNLMGRLAVDEEKLRIIYEEYGISIPDPR